MKPFFKLRCKRSNSNSTNANVLFSKNLLPQVSECDLLVEAHIHTDLPHSEEILHQEQKNGQRLL